METPKQSDQHDPGGGVYTPVGSRRSFFQWVIGGTACIIGLGLAVPLADHAGARQTFTRTDQTKEVMGVSW